MVNAGSALVSGGALESAVNSMVEMGFPREEVRALSPPPPRPLGPPQVAMRLGWARAWHAQDRQHQLPRAMWWHGPGHAQDRQQ
jgi:hypothetical protein